MSGTDSAGPEIASEPAPEISVGEDGEVQLADSFFGGMEPEPEPEPEPQREESEGASAPETPADYTDDELRDTPWEQWDVERIHGDVKRYIPLIQEQMQRRAAAMAMMRGGVATTQPPVQAPAAPSRLPLTQKEIATEATKLARERLGLKEGDDLDFYEPEHVAALSIAAQEIKAKDQAELQRSAQVEQQRREFGAFAADMASRPDFAEFDQWVTSKLAAAGMHPRQLEEYAARTGDIVGVQNTVMGWYQAWRQQKVPAPQPQQRPKVPTVETAVGAVAAKKAIDLREFGDMDEDAQARALMEAGLV